MESKDMQETIREVYVADMQGLVRIYRQQGHGKVLAAGAMDDSFGIPLAVLQRQGQTVAFASFVDDEGAGIKINLYFNGCNAGQLPEGRLRAYAEAVFARTFGGDAQKKPFAPSIARLRDWIISWA